MAYKLTKRGSMDNEITNEFICDYIEDRDAIPASQINLGTVAIILKPATQVFMADSEKEWIPFGLAATDSSNDNEELQS